MKKINLNFVLVMGAFLVILSSCATSKVQHSFVDLNKERIEKELNVRYNNGSILVKGDAVQVDRTYENTKVYFIAGAGYNPKSDPTKKVNFTNEMILTGQKLFKDNFLTLRTSSKKIPFMPLRAGLNGKWSILHGYAPVDYNKHKNVRRSIDEIVAHYHSGDSAEAVNIIGSSYGSVVAAQTAIGLLEEDNGIDKIDVLTLSATMIHPESELAYTLAGYVAEKRIDEIYYQSTPGDNVMGASGTDYFEALRGFRSVVLKYPSIIDIISHPHNVASKLTDRADLIYNLITDKIENN